MIVVEVQFGPVAVSAQGGPVGDRTNAPGERERDRVDRLDARRLGAGLVVCAHQRVDGATRWQQFRAITLPSLKPALVPAVILSVVWTFNMFNIIFLVSGGEPGGANEILITKAYKIAFEQYQYAYAAAYSTVIFIILLVYGYFQTRMTRATESY